MPGKGHLPDLQERILRGLKANTNRTAGGLGTNASPGMTRDRVAAMRRGAPASGGTLARASYVDVFSIADDSDSSFSLTYTPVFDSWNVMLNGLRVHQAEFDVTGRSLSIVDAADLFLGADTQGSPWDLEVQYDYLTGVPVSPPPELELGNTASATGSSPQTATFSTAPAAGSSVLMSFQAFFGGTSASVSGLGATWTQIATATGGTGSADGRQTELWLGVGCNGVGTGITVTGDDMTLHAVEVIGSLTATGAQVNTAVNPDVTAGPLTATAPGVAASLTNAPSGVTITPTAGWTVVAGTFLVQPVGSGTVVEVTATSWAHAIMAVVHQ